MDTLPSRGDNLRRANALLTAGGTLSTDGGAPAPRARTTPSAAAGFAAALALQEAAARATTPDEQVRLLEKVCVWCGGWGGEEAGRLFGE